MRSDDDPVVGGQLATSTAIPLAEPSAASRATAPHVLSPMDRRGYAKLICALHDTPAENKVQAGRVLIEAKAALPRGEFEAMVERDLTFGPRWARALMAIARHPVLGDRKHASVLPASVATLYELTRVNEEVLTTALADGRITPATQRKQVRALLPRQGKRLSTKPRAKADTDDLFAGLIRAAEVRGDTRAEAPVFSILLKRLQCLQRNFDGFAEIALVAAVVEYLSRIEVGEPQGPDDADPSDLIQQNEP